MTLEYVLLILVLIITMIILNESLQATLATSPSFVRQEISDELNNDGWNYREGQFTRGHKYADLSSITYSSNGRFLNATLFFPRLIIIEKPLTVNYTAYGMLFDIDSNYNTGWQGYDYMMKVEWENNTKNWTYILQEWSSDSTTRVLENRTNFTSFLDDKESRYAYISLDLEKINFPDKYTVVFFTDYDFQEGDVKYEISDFSNAARIPPKSALILSPSEKSITLKPGEKKTIEIQFEPSTKNAFPSHVNLSTNHINGLETYFNPNELLVPPIATSQLTIKAAADLKPNPYTLQISAWVDLPLPLPGKIATTQTDPLSSISPTTTQTDPLSSISPTTTQTDLLSSILPITVEAFSFGEQFSNFWATYGDPINLIAGGFAAGFAALVFGKLSKKRKGN